PVKMAFRSFPVEKQDYERRSGKVTNQRPISQYSVTIDREVKNDRSNAKYLVEQNIRNGVYFDLSLGLKTFVDKGVTLENEPYLTPLCKWAISQPGATIKEVFGGAEFASWRSTLQRIGMTVLNNPWNKFPTGQDAWTIVAQEFGGVILISEESREHDGELRDIASYSSFKFKQFMTTDRPDGRPDTTSPVDNRSTFEMMVRTDLVDGDNKLLLCCGTEVDALRRGVVPIEFKTAWDGTETGFFRDVVTVMQSELVGVQSIVTGVKKGDIRYEMIYVHKVVEKQVHDIKWKNNIMEAVGQSYSFLFDLLTRVKKFLTDHSACEVSFDPTMQQVVIKSISRLDAKKNGHGVTDEFLARLNILPDRSSTSNPLDSTRKAMQEFNLSKAFSYRRI
ncbi:hypothetical protein PMAYCL1PPCAC_24865, partial [Pristionchus mayeri]